MPTHSKKCQKELIGKRLFQLMLLFPIKRIEEEDKRVKTQAFDAASHYYAIQCIANRFYTGFQLAL